MSRIKGLKRILAFCLACSMSLTTAFATTNTDAFMKSKSNISIDEEIIVDNSLVSPMLADSPRTVTGISYTEFAQATAGSTVIIFSDSQLADSASDGGYTHTYDGTDVDIVKYTSGNQVVSVVRYDGTYKFPANCTNYFANQTALRHIYVVNSKYKKIVDFSGITNATSMFSNCYNLETWFEDSQGNSLFELPAVSNVSNTFLNCAKLASAPIIDFSNITGATAVYSGTSFKTATIANLKCSAPSMFANSRIVEVTFTGTCTPTNTSGMFMNCLNLATLTIPGTFTKIDDKFAYNCPSLTKIDASAITVSKTLGTGAAGNGLGEFYIHTPYLTNLTFGPGNVTFSGNTDKIFYEGDTFRSYLMGVTDKVDTSASIGLSGEQAAAVEFGKNPTAYLTYGQLFEYAYEVPDVSIIPVLKSGTTWYNDDGGIFPRESVTKIDIASTGYNWESAMQKWPVNVNNSLYAYRFGTADTFLVEMTDYKTRAQLIEMANAYGGKWSNQKPDLNVTTGTLDFPAGSTVTAFSDQTFWPILSYETRYVIFNNDPTSVYEIMTHEFGFVDQFPRKQGFVGSEIIIRDTTTNGIKALALNEDAAYTFYNFTNLASLCSDKIDTSRATSLAYVCANTYKLTNVNVGGWDVSNVTDLTKAFYNAGITRFNGGTWNTRFVRDLSSMFSGCPNLVYVDTGIWDTSSVQYANDFVADCSKLTNIDGMSDWNMTNMVDISSMFKNNPSLTFNLGTVVTGNKLTKASSVFQGCANATTISVPSTLTKNVSDVSYFYDGCLKLVTPSSLNISNAKYANGMYRYCQSLTGTLSVQPNANLITNIAEMFKGCSKLTGVNFNVTSLALLEDVNSLFQGCIAMTTDNVSVLKSSTPVNMSNMYQGCRSMNSLDISALNFRDAIDISGIVNGCTQITSLDMSAASTAELVNMNMAFANLSNCTSLKLPTSLAKVKQSQYALSGCTKIQTLDIPASLSVIGKGFGANMPVLKTINFKHAAGATISFPEPGSTTGAFYLPSITGTEVKYASGNQSIAGYDWGADNRDTSGFLAVASVTVNNYAS